jgi:hypothetical protein
MRKDYFVSEEEKQRRRKRLVDSMHHSTVPLPSKKITSPSVPLPPSTQVVLKMAFCRLNSVFVQKYILSYLTGFLNEKP